MEVGVAEERNLPEEETVTMGSPHPGLSVFQPNNALRYFNTEYILKEELKEDNNKDLYLENKNICFAIERIFNIQMSLTEQSVKINDNSPKDIETPLHKLRSTDGEIRYTSKHAQLIEKFRLDLTLPENDFDSSLCVSLSSSITDTPSKIKEEPITKDDTFENKEESTSVDDNRELSSDLVSLFWLMSVLPEPTASKCKQVLDKDQFAWKITLYDVILILLNWGATLQSLGLEGMNVPTHLLSPKLSPSPLGTKTNNKKKFLIPSTVDLVLNSICERLPNPSSPQMPFSHRVLLVKLLLYAALDDSHRRHMNQYCRTIRSVLDTIQPWGPDQAGAIVNVLQLDCLGLNNSLFVCCSLFNMACSRLNLVGMLASHKALHLQFGLSAEVSFSDLIKHLLCPSELLKRFRLWHVYILTCHIHSLLVRNTCQMPPCSKAVVVTLQQWTMEVRSALTQYPYTYSMESGHVRERLCRLTSECATITRSINKTYI